MNAISQSDFAGHVVRNTLRSRPLEPDEIGFTFSVPQISERAASRFSRLVKRTLNDLLIDIDVVAAPNTIGRYRVDVVAKYS